MHCVSYCWQCLLLPGTDSEGGLWEEGLGFACVCVCLGGGGGAGVDKFGIPYLL